MKVCVISPGVAHAVPRTVAIVDHCDEVHFVDIRGNADRATLEAHGIHYHLPGENARFRIGAMNVQFLLREIDPDVIVCHYTGGDHFFSAVAYGRCPVAAVAMGNDVLYDEGDTHVSAIQRLLTRMGLRRVGYLAAKSNLLYQRIRSYGVTAPMDVNYWGVDLDHFRSAGSRQARETIGLQVAGPVILSARAIEPRLNVLMIVEAMPGILERYPDATLLILGRSAPDYRRQVIEAVSRLDLQSRVVFADEVTQQALVDYYNASDVTVSMASSEGFPNTLLEVMCCRIPIVVGRIPQIEELLIDEDNAMICEFSAESIVSAVVKVLADAEQANAMVARARCTAKQHADISRNGRVFAENLKPLLASGPAPRARTLVFRLFFAACLVQRRLRFRQR